MMNEHVLALLAAIAVIIAASLYFSASNRCCAGTPKKSGFQSTLALILLLGSIVMAIWAIFKLSGDAGKEFVSAQRLRASEYLRPA